MWLGTWVRHLVEERLRLHWPWDRAAGGPVTLRLSTLQWTLLSEEKPKARGLRRDGTCPAGCSSRTPTALALTPSGASGRLFPIPESLSAFPAASFWAEAGHWLSPRICFSYRLSPPSRVTPDNQRSRPDLGQPGPRSGLSCPFPAPSCPPSPDPILAVRPASPAVPTPDPGPSVTATLISGGVPGLLGVTRVFPIDLAEARLQNQRGQESYKGTGSLWLQTPHPRGFLPGAVVNLTAVTPEKAVKLAASDVRQQLLEEDGAQWNLKLEMLAGCGAGLCQAAVTCPLEVLKIPLQRAGRLGEASPTFEDKELTEEGVLPQFPIKKAGQAVAVPLGSSLSSRDILLDNIDPRARSLEPRTDVLKLGQPSALGRAGPEGLPSLPAARRQGSAASPAPRGPLYPGRRPAAALIARELLRTQGLVGLYRGLGAALLRDIPFSVIYFPLFAKLNLLGVREPTGKASFAHSFTSGCVAGPVTPLEAEYIAGGAA
ncbi:mitochondrial glutamate carrier 2 [Eschrichtius robustus]|uniref:mitochondrial glutamate carrier 2 n=1 Tax=Eschrichtius robustus TaxID=9764 RepID=UPI0035BF32A8